MEELEGHQHTNACDTGCCERLEAEGETAVARLLIDGGDLAHAANHVGGAVGTDPALPEAYEVLAELVAKAGGPLAALELFPETVSYVGAHACRAALLAAVGRTSEAVFLLGAVIGAVPASPWASAAWLGALADPDTARAVDPDHVCQALAHVTQAIDDPAQEPVRSCVAPYYAVVRQVVELHPEHKALLCLASSLARRMDDLDTAIAWAKAAGDFRYGPSGGDALGVTMLGSALRRAGRTEEAVKVWGAIVRQDPAQTYLATDLAETLAGIGRAREGIEILEQVQQRVPDHDKAVPALYGLRYQVTRDSRHLVALHDHLSQYPEHGYAGYLLERWCAGSPWLSGNDFATEATTNAVREFVKRGNLGPDSAVTMRLSGYENPSSVLAAQLIIPKFSVEVEKIPQPDPRRPVREVEVEVWTFDGTEARPAQPAPSAKATALARDLATHRWDTPPALYDRGFALSELTLPDLLGLLVQPPAPQDAPWPEELAAKNPDVWMRAVQVLACAGIAHHRADQPWESSERRKVLLDLLDGPEDWVCEAAGMALVAVGWVFPETREEIGQRVVARTLTACEAYRTRPVAILESLLRLALACGWLDEKMATSMRGILAKASGEEEPAAEPDREKPRRKLFGRR